MYLSNTMTTLFTLFFLLAMLTSTTRATNVNVNFDVPECVSGSYLVSTDSGSVSVSLFNKGYYNEDFSSLTMNCSLPHIGKVYCNGKIDMGNHIFDFTQFDFADLNDKCFEVSSYQFSPDSISFSIENTYKCNRKYNIFDEMEITFYENGTFYGSLEYDGLNMLVAANSFQI